MTIGVLYIAISEYIIFLDDFYNTSMRYLLPESEKHYFVFSDRHIETRDNVTLIYKEYRGWLHNTLNRFDMFIGIKESLKQLDFLFFFNANTLFKRVILPKDIIPNADEKLFAGTIMAYISNKGM